MSVGVVIDVAVPPESVVANLCTIAVAGARTP